MLEERRGKQSALVAKAGTDTGRDMPQRAADLAERRRSTPELSVY